MQPVRFKLNKSLSSLLSSTGRISVILSLLASSGLAQATLAERDQARRIHERLTGVPPSNAVLDSMEAEIAANGAVSAASIAMNNPSFANVTLKNFAAPWTNEAQSVFVPLNDYSATVIGLIRDGEDFRKVLYDDVIYRGNVSGIANYSSANNNHYEDLELKGPVDGDLSDPGILVKDVQSAVVTNGLPSNATAGVMTTRAAAEAFFSGGTNRAMFRFTLMNHLCTDLEPLKDESRTPDRVRQDVSRSPGGDSRIFMFSCVGCHAGMDGLAGAFAYYEYNSTSGAMEYTANTVSGKHLINSTNFPHGYVTDDDSWVNYWRTGQNKLLNWSPTPVTNTNIDAKGIARGNGAKSLGEELANSKAFGRCQVKKAFQAVCLHDPDDYASDRTAVDAITASFMTTDNYNMKTVFAKVADHCKDIQTP